MIIKTVLPNTKETVILCLEYFLGREKFEEIFVKEVVLLLKEWLFLLSPKMNKGDQRMKKKKKM